MLAFVFGFFVKDAGVRFRFVPEDAGVRQRRYCILRVEAGEAGVTHAQCRKRNVNREHAFFYRGQLKPHRSFVRVPGRSLIVKSRALIVSQHSQGFRNFDKFLKSASDYFLVYVVASAAIAFVYPPSFSSFGPRALTIALGIIMFSMGMTLRLHDFEDAAKQPFPIVFSFICHYTIMPALGLLFGILYDLDVPMRVGLVLAASCPAGTASNVMTYLARGNVALSVVMSSVNYLGAAITTPFLTKLLVGRLIPVNAVALALSTAQVVIVPVLAGAAFNSTIPSVVNVIKPYAPLVASLATCLCLGTVLAKNKMALIASGWKFVLSVFSIHLFGFILGYYSAKLAGLDRFTQRSISLQVGTISGALGVVLAQHFPEPRVALASAISTVFMLVIGISLASIWRWSDDQKFDPKKEILGSLQSVARFIFGNDELD